MTDRYKTMTESSAHRLRRVIWRAVTLFLLLAVQAVCLGSCVDDLEYSEEGIPAGETVILAEIRFSPLVTAEMEGLKSRSADPEGSSAPGGMMDQIDCLHVLVYSSDGKLHDAVKVDLDIYRPVLEDRVDADAVSGTAAQKQTYCVKDFPLKLSNGMYYIYAVANIPDLLTEHAGDIETKEGLRDIKVRWDGENISRNREMFGYFTNGKVNTLELDFEADAKVEVSPSKRKDGLHAWIRRTVSKLTIDFDGSGLRENVEVYIKDARIYDIADGVYLGHYSCVGTPPERDDRVPVKDGGFGLFRGESGMPVIVYGQGSDYKNWPVVTKTTNLADYKTPGNADPVSLHDETAFCLPFYENMQGKGARKYQDADGDGKIDNPQGGEHTGEGADRVWTHEAAKDSKPNGTYVEVSGYYRSMRADYRSEGEIKYRFMLGKDEIDNFDCERNHHYKLTLAFKGNGNDVDWHIEYGERIRVLDVTQPHELNYQGKYFIPDSKIPNLGRKFSYDTLIVTSYEGQRYDFNNRDYRNWTVSYREEGAAEFSPTCSWLECKPCEMISSHQQKVTFAFTPFYEEINIDSKLRGADPKGAPGNPYDLADDGGTKNDRQIGSTANCYMIDAPGVYMFPLVYGNAITAGQTYAASYDWSATSGEDYLGRFVNHMDAPISGPYVRDSGYAPAKPRIVWQDEKDLVTDLTYVPAAYGGVGGISFQVKQRDIKQGNAVIAIEDDQQRVMWSWHIWVTRFDFEKTIQVTTGQYNDATPTYDLMPVNLGWCSGHDDIIRYYKPRACEVKFTSGELEQTIRIIQHPHTAFTRGNNPYYQWGRKDPFYGSEIPYGNKEWYDRNGTKYEVWGPANNPERFFSDTNNSTSVDESERKTTRQMLGQMIQHPERWLNPPREKRIYSWGESQISRNLTYGNLWGADNLSVKTVYDPCPVGYAVPHYNAFTGFNVIDKSGPWWVVVQKDEQWMYDVSKSDVLAGNPTDNVYEFYTNPSKLRSVIFPESGYRDWDASAAAISIGVYDSGTKAGDMGIGYAWSRICSNPSYSGENVDASYNFEFSHVSDGNGNLTKGINPINPFTTTDGLPVRAVRQVSQ